MDKLLTLKDLADRWQMSEGSLRNNLYNDKREMPKVTRINKTVRFRIEDVEEFELSVMKELD